LALALAPAPGGKKSLSQWHWLQTTALFALQLFWSDYKVEILF